MVNLEDKQKYSSLLDVYGALLTERQKDFLDLYYNEDLSFGEIAESEKISRQAVHDTIQHGRKTLERFEEHLGLLQRKDVETVDQPEGKPIDLDVEQIRKILEELSRLVREDLIYNMEPIRSRVLRLQEIIEESGSK